MPKAAYVSIIIPCRNEERFIGECLDSIVASDYPKDRLEVLGVDGMSDDKTPEILEEYARQFSFIRVVANPKRSRSHALNLGVENSRGEFIFRVDGHSALESNYVSQCLRYMEEYSADRVGGRMKIIPQDNTLMGKAIALALASPFGVGNARFKTALKGDPPEWVDTVMVWCCKKDLFRKTGLFNVDIEQSEDIEYSARLSKHGGKTLLVPSIQSHYYARSGLKACWKRNFSYGVWAILPFKYASGVPLALRHLVPLAFVGSFVGFGVLSLVMKFFFPLFLAIFGSYLSVSAGFSMALSFRERDLRYFFVLPVAFATFHFAYGLGSLRGLASLSASKLTGCSK